MTGRIRHVTDGDIFRLESGEHIRVASIYEKKAAPLRPKRAAARLKLDYASGERATQRLAGRFQFDTVGKDRAPTTAKFSHARA